MSEQRKAISRQELYEKVWTTPIVRLAQELGYSYPELFAIIAAQQRIASGCATGCRSSRQVMPPHF